MDPLNKQIQANEEQMNTWIQGWALVSLIEMVGHVIGHWIWANYGDLNRGHPKCWSSSVKSRLVKYYNLARFNDWSTKHLPP